MLGQFALLVVIMSLHACCFEWKRVVHLSNLVWMTNVASVTFMALVTIKELKINQAS